MRRIAAVTLILCLSLVISSSRSLAQSDDKTQAQPESKRKVISRVAPSYPDFARRIALRGTVKVEAVVGMNGIVRSVDVKGGHPLLVQAAAAAVSKWKWEPASHETREPVEVRFDPQ
jgi:TonB family protein